MVRPAKTHCLLPDLCGPFNDVPVRVTHHGHQQIQQENRDNDDVDDQECHTDISIGCFGIGVQIEISQHA